MSQPPKKKKRKLPKDITERPDAEAVELILGKRVKKELDRIVQETAKKGVNDSIYEYEHPSEPVSSA